MTLVTQAAGPANGWANGNEFGAFGFGGAGGSGFANTLGGALGGPTQNAWGNQAFIPGDIALSPSQSLAVSGSQWTPSNVDPNGNWGNGSSLVNGFGQSIFSGSAPSSSVSGYGLLPSYGASGGYQTLTSPGGNLSGILGGGSGSPFNAGLSFGSNGGGGASFGDTGSLGTDPTQFGQLADSLGPGGSFTPQFLQEASSLGFSPAMAQDFSTAIGQDEANLPSQYATPMEGNLADFNISATPAQLVPFIGQVESGNNPNAPLVDYAGNRSVNGQYQQSQGFVNQYGSGPQGIINAASTLLSQIPGATLGMFYSLYNAGKVLPWNVYSAIAPLQAKNFTNNLGQFGLSSDTPLASLIGGQGAEFMNGFAIPGAIAGGIPEGYVSPFSGGGALTTSNPYAPYGLWTQSGNFGYPALGNSSLSNNLLTQMGFSTGNDFSSQVFNNLGMQGYEPSGGYMPADTSFNSDSSYYTYGNDIGNNPSDYSGVGDYNSSFDAGYTPANSGGGVTDLGSYGTDYTSGDVSGSYSDSSGDF